MRVRDSEIRLYISEACVTNLTITCVLQDDVSVQHGGPRLPPHVSEDAQPDGRMAARRERIRARLRLPDTPPCNVRLLCCVNVLGGPTWCSRKLYGKPIYCSNRNTDISQSGHFSVSEICRVGQFSVR